MLHPVYWLEHPPDLVMSIISKRLIAGWWATCDLLTRLEGALKEGRDEVEAAHAETLNRCSGRLAAKNRKDVALRVEHCV